MAVISTIQDDDSRHATCLGSIVVAPALSQVLIVVSIVAVAISVVHSRPLFVAVSLPSTDHNFYHLPLVLAELPRGLS